jgi:hypothetical protein
MEARPVAEGALPQNKSPLVKQIKNLVHLINWDFEGWTEYSKPGADYEKQ